MMSMSGFWVLVIMGSGGVKYTGVTLQASFLHTAGPLLCKLSSLHSASQLDSLSPCTELHVR